MRETQSRFAARLKAVKMCAAVQLVVQSVMKGGVYMIAIMKEATDAMTPVVDTWRARRVALVGRGRIQGGKWQSIWREKKKGPPCKEEVLQFGFLHSNYGGHGLVHQSGGEPPGNELYYLPYVMQPCR